MIINDLQMWWSSIGWFTRHIVSSRSL